MADKARARRQACKANILCTMCGGEIEFLREGRTKCGKCARAQAAYQRRVAAESRGRREE